MKIVSSVMGAVPSAKSLLLAIGTSILLIIAFPDFGFWIFAWVGLTPLFIAVNREKMSFSKAFVLGWIGGTIFFFATCWWLTFAPITYAGVPAIAAYFLLFCVTAFVGLYVALFSGMVGLCLRRFGSFGIVAAPFLWTAIEFLRLWTSGNNWNALGYSQAFNASVNLSSIGGVSLVSFCIVASSSALFLYLESIRGGKEKNESRFHPSNLAGSLIKMTGRRPSLTEGEINLLTWVLLFIPILIGVAALYLTISFFSPRSVGKPLSPLTADSYVIAVQPNVPMSGLTQSKWLSLRSRQTQAAERAINHPDFSVLARRQAELDGIQENIEKRTRFYEELALESLNKGKKLVILPESPMNFQFEQDSEFRSFIKEFARQNKISVLFNSAEPDRRYKGGYFNSAVLVDPDGIKTAQYDKIYLLPFGEFVPLPGFLADFVPTMVGRFSSGEEYDLLPIGDARAGVMICFESHFASLSRQYVRNGADLIIEMTNDGYLGNTPVLRQHLASAVFRAVETNRPVLRVTNVGVTAYINQIGEILDTADVYEEATRVWAVSKSDRKHTLYVMLGDWVAVLCSVVTLALLFICIRKRNVQLDSK